MPAGRRVFVEDARRNGQFLRVTWHAEGQQFVVSNWDGNVCVGATRVPVAEAPSLVALLVQGVADAAARPHRPTERTRPRTLRDHLRAWWQERTATAAIRQLRHDNQVVHSQRRRSAS